MAWCQSFGWLCEYIKVEKADKGSVWVKAQPARMHSEITLKFYSSWCWQGECMSVGFCSPPLGYIRGFRRSFQDRMSAQPGFILCPPNNLALHRLLLYTFYSAPYLHNIVLFTHSHHTFEDFILCRQKSYTLVYFGCPVGNAHPYHSPQPTYILRSKISSALHQQMLSVQVNPDTLPYSSPLLLFSSPFH